VAATDDACTVAMLQTDERTALRHAVGPLDPERPVSGACCIVRAADVDFVERHELIYIGVAEVVAELGAAAFVRRCLEQGAAAIAWPEWLDAAVVVALREALREAESAGQGVGGFEMPGDLRFTTVSRVIAQSNAMPESARFQRLLHMQQQLVEALAADPPVEALVDALARMTGGIAGVTSEDGSVEAASGALPFMLFRQEAQQAVGGEVLIDVAGWTAVGCVLRTLPGESARWLFIARRSPTFASAFVRAAARVAGSLIDATRRVNEIVADQDRATRAVVLREALETAPHEHSELLATRAGALGIDFVDEVRVLELSRSRARSRSAAAETLRDQIVEAAPGASLLVLEHDEGATVLAQCTAEVLEVALRRLLRAEASLVVGIGRPMRRINEARASWHDATLAAQSARRGKDRRVVRYDDFDLGTRLLADVDRTDMAYWVGQLLAPLRQKPMLLETLTAFFDEELDIMRTAKRLEVHHNTLRYRLSKIEAALGGSLQSPALIASLHLALSAERAPGGASGALRPSGNGGGAIVDAADGDIVSGPAVAARSGADEQPIVS
jgi:hypothetical protein